MTTKNIHASNLGKLSHKKSPRSREFYEKMWEASAKKRKKLSTKLCLRKQNKKI